MHEQRIHKGTDGVPGDIRPKFELSPGDYSNIKYWSVSRKQNSVVIRPAFPWGSYIGVQLGVGGIAFGIFYLFYMLSNGFQGADDKTLLMHMSIPMGFALIGCIVLPIFKINSERRKGDILTYGTDTECLVLHRENLSLKKDQLVEFEIISENRHRKKALGRNPSTVSTAAELKVVFKNPNVRSVTILRAECWRMFNDVIKAIKMHQIAAIRLVDIESGSGASTVASREL